VSAAARLVAALLRHAEEVACRPSCGPLGEAAEYREWLLDRAEQVAS
jgi:hypothetical protein